MTKPAKLGLYWSGVPLILAGLSTVTFLIAGLSMAIWDQPLYRVALLALLAVEMYFLPYLLLPLVMRLPALVPWADFDLTEELGIDGTDRVRQRALVMGLILLPGIATLGAYGSAPSDLHWSMQIGIDLLYGARLPVGSAVLLCVVLALPDLTPMLNRLLNRRGS